MAIRKINTPAGVRFVADLYQVGAGGERERYRKRFRTRAAADAAEAAGVARRDKDRIGAALTPRQQIDAADALKVLAGRATLLAVARAWAVAQDALPAPVTMGAAVKEFLGAREKRGGRERYMATLTQALRAAGKAGGDGRPLAVALGRPELRAWIMSDDVKAITQGNRLRDVRMLIRWAMKRRGEDGQPYLTADPLGDLDRPRTSEDTRPVSILTTAQSEALLKKARETPIFAHVAIGLFAGLRPMETWKLLWGEIDLPRRRVEVKAAKAKTRQRRLVDICDGLAALLAPIAATKTPASPVWEGPAKWGLWRELRQLASDAKIPMPPDVLRHTFASMHLAQHKSADTTAGQLGHRSTDMLFRHYRELVTPEEAAKFWEIPGKLAREK